MNIYSTFRVLPPGKPAEGVRQHSWSPGGADSRRSVDIPGVDAYFVSGDAPPDLPSQAYAQIPPTVQQIVQQFPRRESFHIKQYPVAAEPALPQPQPQQFHPNVWDLLDHPVDQFQCVQQGQKRSHGKENTREDQLPLSEPVATLNLQPKGLAQLHRAALPHTQQSISMQSKQPQPLPASSDLNPQTLVDALNRSIFGPRQTLLLNLQGKAFEDMVEVVKNSLEKDRRARESSARALLRMIEKWGPSPESSLMALLYLYTHCKPGNKRRRLLVKNLPIEFPASLGERLREDLLKIWSADDFRKSAARTELEQLIFRRYDPLRQRDTFFIV